MARRAPTAPPALQPESNGCVVFVSISLLFSGSAREKQQENLLFCGAPKKDTPKWRNGPMDLLALEGKSGEKASSPLFPTAG